MVTKQGLHILESSFLGLIAAGNGLLAAFKLTFQIKPTDLSSVLHEEDLAPAYSVYTTANDVSTYHQII